MLIVSLGYALLDCSYLGCWTVKPGLICFGRDGASLGRDDFLLAESYYSGPENISTDPTRKEEYLLDISKDTEDCCPVINTRYMHKLTHNSHYKGDIRSSDNETPLEQQNQERPVKIQVTM
ncbi:hypothetical protein CR513_02775, partial [Mucuna pruriens]